MRGRVRQIISGVLGLCLTAMGAGGSLWALDRITVRREAGETEIVGRVLVEAQDGGVLLQSRDGALWIVQPEEMVRRETDAVPFQPWGPDEVALQLLAELPAGFKIRQTANYVICYNTSDAYAEWCGGLFERLYRGYHTFWKNRGWELSKPEFPLVAIIFDDQASYARYAAQDLGAATGAIIGYYHLQTNRVTTYDLTGVDGIRKQQRGMSSAAHINQILAQPAAERTVATIVHEATHQLAYNTGLQTRLAGHPMWVSEGLAVYFETPDLGSSRGWRSIGAVHRLHLNRFRNTLPNRPPDALRTLLTDDQQFRDPQTSADAYAAAWALNYYLLQVRREPYVKYLQEEARLAALAEPTSDERLESFRRAFGDSLEKLDEDFVRYIRRVR